MQAVDEDIDLKQMRDMAAAKKRWDGLVSSSLCIFVLKIGTYELLCLLNLLFLQLREGKVKLLTPREAGYAIQLSNKPLLDVRPSSERNKVTFACFGSFTMLFGTYPQMMIASTFTIKWPCYCKEMTSISNHSM